MAIYLAQGARMVTLQTGDFSALPSPDRVNPSGRFKTEMSEDAPKFSLRNADSFMQDVSERGLGGVLGKANVDKLVDDLYMGNEGIRKVSPEAWHNVRTAVQKQLREGASHSFSSFLLPLHP